MINMNMPDFFEGRAIYDLLSKTVTEHPEILYEDVTISSIFGCFPGCIWNGGGMNFGAHWTKKDMVELIEFYNDKLQIPLRFTFTNPVLQEKHLYDTYGNIIAEAGHNGCNEILTSSRILENYLREKYPNYKYCSSIVGTDTKPYANPDNYSLVVMRRRMNNNWEFLDNIAPEHRPKIEFLCNDPCPDNCPRIYSHYRDFGRAQITYDVNREYTDCSMNHVKGSFINHYTHNLETYISREQILKEYLPRGYTQFKVSGRSNLISMVINILEYLIKPEYHMDMWGILLEPHLHFLSNK